MLMKAREPRVHHPYDNNYDYVMSTEDFEKMLMRNNQNQYQYSQPKTYQNMMMSKLSSWSPYSDRQVQGFSNHRPQQRSFNIEEAPEDGTWAGSRDWVATWIQKK